ncbi:hypothetical protein B0H13DRAFT_2277030, partial [Mycena leptocephala]
MLGEYPTNDLFQLYAVVRFFCGILESVPAGDKKNNNHENIDLLLSLEPRGIAGTWEDRSDQFLQENPLYNGYFFLPLENIWTACEVDPPEEDE